MKIVIGCDPNAQSVKEEIIAYINKKGYGIIDDFGSDDVILLMLLFRLRKQSQVVSMTQGYLFAELD